MEATDKGIALNPQLWPQHNTWEKLVNFLQPHTDHIHAYDEEGEVIIVKVTSSEGVTRWLTQLGYAHEPQEFNLILLHRFHPDNYHAPLVEMAEEMDEPAPDGWFRRFMKRLVSW